MSLNYSFGVETAAIYATVNFSMLLYIDGIVKSRKTPLSVIPAKAGIQFIQIVTKALDSGFHRSDDFLRFHHILTYKITQKSTRN